MKTHKRNEKVTLLFRDLPFPVTYLLKPDKTAGVDPMFSAMLAIGGEPAKERKNRERRRCTSL